MITMVGVISKSDTRGKLKILSTEEENRMGEREWKYVLIRPFHL